MTPTIDSPTSPAEDATAIAVQTVEPQQPGALSPTLYALAADLMQLLSLREEMAEAKEDTAEVEKTIATYIKEHLPQKVDAVAHILRTLESQVELATAEVQRLNARRRKIASAIERLKGYCCSVLEMLPQPKRGTRKLEGSTATLVLKGNGGQQKLDVSDEALVPDEYCTATVTMPWNHWVGLVDFCDRNGSPLPADYKAMRAVDEDAVRKALAADCWICDGGAIKAPPGVEQCPGCGGSGKNSLPGARLLERGTHVEIR